MSQAVLLNGVKELLSGVKDSERHPGLVLDKFSLPGKQDTQKDTLGQVCKAGGDQDLLKEAGARRNAVLAGTGVDTWEAGARRNAVLAGTGVDTWEATTSGPLTLHLSRANALENAGIALHPLYGFAYLPGSGLKGAARAYAETVWLPTQADQETARRQIVAVFGCAPASPEEAKESSVGAVVFHDAWPTTWPKLFVDIAAIHQPKYYQAPEGQVPPPGDWETPVLIYFLAIMAGTKFCFAVAPRAAREAAKNHVQLATQWLNGALTTLGVGAKTAAGYGLFKIDAQALAPTPNPDERIFKLTLVTPAFLAGGAQGKEDCDLRGSTLRGQLRWWWRTMHAAHLDPTTLRRLETAVWGASSQGSAIRLHVKLFSGAEPNKFDFKNTNNQQFLQQNNIAIENREKTIQGLYYSSFGCWPMKNRQARWFRQPGSEWQLCIAARASAYNTDPKSERIEPADILCQATAALFLLTRYGGVGAKARKGFGSFADIEVDGIRSIDDCMRVASCFRKLCHLPQNASQHDKSAPSLELMSTPPIEVSTSWTNAWFALNQIGKAMQDYAKTGRHQAWKSALGLPRLSDHMRRGNFKNLELPHHIVWGH